MDEGSCCPRQCPNPCSNEQTTKISMEYPRLLLGITMRQKEFVVHPHSLQILESSWSYGNNRPWSSEETHVARTLFVFFIHTVLIPFTGLMQLINPRPKSYRQAQKARRQRREQVMRHSQFQRSISTASKDQDKQPQNAPINADDQSHKQTWFHEFWTSSFWEFDKPRTRCIRHCGAYIWFLCLLCAEVQKGGNKNLAKYGEIPDGVEMIIIIYLLGSGLQLFRQISAQVSLV